MTTRNKMPGRGQNELSTNERREAIREILEDSTSPLTASSLAEQFSVSRQIIVGDVALLRASGLDVLATPRGYLLNNRDTADDDAHIAIIACCHNSEQMKDELYTIVDFGASIIDVTIEHAIYGELSGKLNLTSRYDVDLFLENVAKEKNAVPISTLTGGVHLHRICYSDEDMLLRIKDALRAKQILID